MTKQEREMQRSQLLLEKELFYKNHPEVSRWVKTKRLLRNLLLAFWVLHAVFSLVFFTQMELLDSGNMEVFKLMMQLFWISVFLNPEGGWKMNIIFYVWALSNFGLLVMNASDMIDMLPYVPQKPLLGVIMFMEAVIPFLLLALAMYLTVPAKHRAMSEQSENFAKETVQKMKKSK